MIKLSDMVLMGIIAGVIVLAGETAIHPALRSLDRRLYPCSAIYAEGAK